jgi:hypothetical protein
MFVSSRLFPMASKAFARPVLRVGLSNFAKLDDADRAETATSNDRAHGARIGPARLVDRRLVDLPEHRGQVADQAVLESMRLRVVKTTGFGLDLAADPKRVPVPVFDEVRRNSHRTAFSTECTAVPVMHCRSNPVSDRILQKTGIFQMWAGDFRLFRSKIVQIWSIETESQFAKGRNWRALIGFTRRRSLVELLLGWAGGFKP